MNSIFTFVLAALASQIVAQPTEAPVCPDWSVAPLQHRWSHADTFVANDPVILRWNTTNGNLEYIQDVALFSANNNEFLHTQYRSYPGAVATTGELSFALSVPLCLQREGVYYLGVYGTTLEGDSCFKKSPDFQLTADPQGDYSVCYL
ncbi:hypothetical protein K493DRAFT_320999 [Basidiobolus meristosporus CBS 931.73]|uniref:Uncharacterized protein n=1 Tax=Basidiobolus meristosporus CBS 931.73 TaxID=1314790 RepID=A0A1Y1X2W2_9FUNG|nr:hypothetical protein K493DRAFT_320999 [Basidiobolus meristosporus CBS 931.73]|eukprot:ORX79736.1 hypothetical protein K493DRAFT_320999 [Basidiobolus meristosporus CBS 931.73]